MEGVHFRLSYNTEMMAMTAGLKDAWQAFEAMLNAPVLGDRIAIALRYMELRWEFLPFDSKRGSGEANALHARFVVNGIESPQTIPQVDALVMSWLIEQNPSDQAVLAFLHIADHLLSPLAKRRVADVLSGKYPVPNGDIVHLWIAPRDVLRLLNPDEESLPRIVNPDENYERTVGDLMTWIRHVSTDDTDRSFDVAMVEYEVLRHFDALWTKGVFKGPLRVGLHPLRGSFKPKLSYTRTEKSRDDESWYFFRAGDITDLDQYRQEIAAAVKAACDPKSGVQLLVFPEFLMTVDGVEALKAALHQESKNGNESTLPLLIFAGSAHEKQDGGAFGNCCVVFDGGGRPVWQQLKRIPFGTEKHDKLLRGSVENLPEDAVGDIHLVEDISALGDYHIRRTPIGSFGVAICSDMTVTIDKSPARVWRSAPVDFIVIPSYTPSTKRFLNVAQTLNASFKTVLFVNGMPVAYTPSPVEEGAEDRWAVAPQTFSPSEGEPVFTAFVSTPWTKPLGMWFGDTVRWNEASQSKPLTEKGLSVDLVTLLRLLS